MTCQAKPWKAGKYQVCFSSAKLSMSPGTWAAITSNGLGPRAFPPARRCDPLNVCKYGRRTDNREIQLHHRHILSCAVRCQEPPVPALAKGVRNVTLGAPFAPLIFWVSLPLGHACLACTSCTPHCAGFDFEAA